MLQPPTCFGYVFFYLFLSKRTHTVTDHVLCHWWYLATFCYRIIAWFFQTTLPLPCPFFHWYFVLFSEINNKNTLSILTHSLERWQRWWCHMYYVRPNWTILWLKWSKVRHQMKYEFYRAHSKCKIRFKFHSRASQTLEKCFKWSRQIRANSTKEKWTTGEWRRGQYLKREKDGKTTIYNIMNTESIIQQSYR